MTFRETEHIFIAELIEIYPKEEIRAIFRIVLEHKFHISPIQFHLKANEIFPENYASQIYNIIQQLKQYKPIQYILGETEFYGMRFIVDENVLIPRPETEELVQWVINETTSENPVSVLDIGTGSGCIAVSLAKTLPLSKVTALDISVNALNIAKKNADTHKVNVEFLQKNILEVDPMHFQKFDRIVSNPPYVDHEQKKHMHQNVVNFEPHIALFAPEKQPLLFYDSFARFASQALNPDGLLFVEINEKYPEQTDQIMKNYGFKTELKCDINNKYRMLKAKKNG